MKKAIVNFCGWAASYWPKKPVPVGEARIYYWHGSTCWYWHCVAANGEVVCQGEGYKTRQGVLKGIANVRALMSGATVLER